MEEKKLTPIKAIRVKCLDCCCGSVNEVKLCPCQTCPLWPFREGKNPYRPELSQEEKTRRAELMKKVRASTKKKTENPAEV